MKNDWENTVNNFYNNLAHEEMGAFNEKCTGYCAIYAPYAIHLIETDDPEYLDFVLVSIQATIAQQQVHDSVWMLFQTEEVPRRYFDEWYSHSAIPQNSQKEIKNYTMTDKIYEVYNGMLTVAQEIQKMIEKGKGDKLDQTIRNNTLDHLPAQEDLVSAIGPEQQTLAEFLDFIEPPDILLEKELCWPVEPDLDY